MPIAQGQVGIQSNADGTSPVQGFRQGKQGDMIVSELHGSFYEQTVRGNVYSIGCNLTALSAATILLTASGQPIVGVWNPSTSGVNVVIMSCTLVAAINNVTSVAPGAYILAASVGNNATLTASLNPFNRKTLASTGSAVKAFSLSTASLMTGLTNNLAFFCAPEFPTASALLTTTVSAATPTPSVVGVEQFDGNLIVPPGGVLGLFNTVSSTTHSVAAHMIWEEVPV
ncbi:hypothetical protein UFOVP1528_36 [uncultured Caudovirales phage]|uniref:Uncharacterized protein n=1 Tax=uncultured Caudovirales phage TaxID=2100421 RepID=A0A6J5PGD0_9CAUD|nr:hypothetical protein UFOVP905_39 [uncultured Caudovirales phage]CAB4182899.1 hypothetical protein UFOVP1080_27 [uncultured Caudovirales phage]CAB4197323.1 hypothetical protein UFOVP1321_15 [uncultured Caudovirales phage]CAB4212921.1 hypothetical protein UFOVP1432_48 [uncultured Caudovirales phage]CAB5227416.1 hypothetical protein UFOVP1528_36 [uncultured Caudovirales phage]